MGAMRAQGVAVVLRDRASHRIAVARREPLPPAALEPEHPPVPAPGLCRPAFYVLACPSLLLLVLWSPDWWPLVFGVIGLRYLAALRTSQVIQADLSYIWLPIQDLLSIVMWAGGFFGREITWRTRRFTIDRLGRFHAADEGLESTNERCG